MTDDDLIRMAKVARVQMDYLFDLNHEVVWSLHPSMQQFARLVAAAEREAIIQMMPGGNSVDPQWVCDAIRARGNDE